MMTEAIVLCICGFDVISQLVLLMNDKCFVAGRWCCDVHPIAAAGIQEFVINGRVGVTHDEVCHAVELQTDTKSVSDEY